MSLVPPGQNVRQGEMSPGRNVHQGEMSPGRNVRQGEMSPDRNVRQGEMSPGRNVHQAKMSTSQNLRQGKMSRKKGIFTLSPCHAMSNVPVYTHIQDPTRFYTRVFDAPFIAHKVTVKCVFMKTYVLESFDYCMIVCKTKNSPCAILQNNCQSAYKER